MKITKLFACAAIAILMTATVASAMPRRGLSPSLNLEPIVADHYGPFNITMEAGVVTPSP